MLASWSMTSAASSMNGTSVRHAMMLHTHERYCSATIVPMMQLSHLVFRMRRLSCSIQRVEMTDCAKQQHACTRRRCQRPRPGGRSQRLPRTRKHRCARKGGKVTSRQRQNSGQSFSFILPEHGQWPAQQMYLDMSSCSAFLRFEYDAHDGQNTAKQKTVQAHCA